MNPQKIYDDIERAWQEAAVHAMVLKEIVEGRQRPNPAAFSHAQQMEDWRRTTKRLRRVLDGLADLKAATPVQGVEAQAPGGLVWSREKPKADGFYWYRVPGQTKQSVDLVQLFTGSPCWHSAERHAWVPITWDLEWAGPISEPSEPAGLPEAVRPEGSTPPPPEGSHPLPLDLEAIEARHKAAIPGPWFNGQAQDGEQMPDGSGYAGDYFDTDEIMAPPSDDEDPVFLGQVQDEGSRAFIIHAWKDLQDLIAEVRRLRDKGAAA